MIDDVRRTVDRVYREEWGRIVASLIRLTGDWDVAEECTQDAFVRALEVWQGSHLPSNPTAWITTTARNRALDRLRRDVRLASKLKDFFVLSGLNDQPPQRGPIVDDRLRLIFSCCHPALTFDAQVALTLRTLGGLTIEELARAFMVSDQTMAKRLVRAKQKIRTAGIPYRVPPAHLLPARTSSVLAVLYLLFNEGYSATAGAAIVRHDLCAEAIRLARLLVELLPQEPEAEGQLALMLLHSARLEARVDRNGEFVVLDEQDRSLWNQAAIAEGVEVLDRAARRGPRGPYQLQAAIAACHCRAPHADATDWPEIVRLYDELVGLVPTPAIRLNRAVAVSMADGPAVGLRLIQRLQEEGQLANYYLLEATKADLLRRLGRWSEAADAYRSALDAAKTDVERRFLARRLAEVSSRA
jgi:RNA polymerase sigma-70 factor, ECF subfamily